MYRNNDLNWGNTKVRDYKYFKQSQNHSIFLLFQGYGEDMILNIFKLFSAVFYERFARQFPKTYLPNCATNLTEKTMEKVYFKVVTEPRQGVIKIDVQFIKSCSESKSDNFGEKLFQYS